MALGTSMAQRPAATRALLLLAAMLAATACGVAGFGGSLQLNITDLQSRELSVLVRGPAADARLVEIVNNVDHELGTGSARIDRYLLQRATFGRGVAVALFLCPKPCRQPIDSYLVAYSPDQIFTADGELQLHFRIEPTSGVVEEISRTITAEMLPALWERPVVEIGGPTETRR